VQGGGGGVGWGAGGVHIVELLKCDLAIIISCQFPSNCVQRHLGHAAGSVHHLWQPVERGTQISFVGFEAKGVNAGAAGSVRVGRGLGCGVGGTMRREGRCGGGGAVDRTTGFGKGQALSWAEGSTRQRLASARYICQLWGILHSSCCIPSETGHFPGETFVSLVSLVSL
jgi:hypothetical protein